jgi:hypothetical protein
MDSLNRSVIMVKPKLPYIEWANSLDDDGPKLNIEKPFDEYTIYLVDEVVYQSDFEKVLKKHYMEIFEYELFSWHTDEEDWPQERDLRTFRKWFSVESHSLVIDLCNYALEIE